MFIRYFTELSLPRRLVEEALLHAPSDWLPGLLEAACARAGELVAEVGLAGTGPAGGRSEVEIGPARSGADRTVLPITCCGTEGPTPLPDLVADIEIAALGSSRTQLSLSALCDPPADALGETSARLLFHRIVEAAIKDFLDRAKEAIEGLAGPVSPTAVGRRAS